MSICTYENTLISIVTPVYNGERFVQKAYDCLCRQTHKNWEWVVVDDGSTDHSYSLLQELASHDARLSCFTQPNSGSCKYPRDRAVAMSKGQLLVPLDIDDYLSDDYLATMLQRITETDANIVYPQMLFINGENNEEMLTLPVADFDTERIYEGKELVKYTMPDWRIGCNGGIYRRQAWLNMSYPEKREPAFVYSDEVDERIFQIHAKRIAFSKARYYYLNYATSLTGNVSHKKFHLLRTSIELKDVVKEAFGTESEEYKRANTKLFYGWRSMMKLYAKHHRELIADEGEILRNLRTAFDHIEPRLLKRSERIKFLNLCSYGLLFAIFCLKYSPALLPKKVLQHFCPNLYRWTVVRHHTEKQTREQIASSYTDTEQHSHTAVKPYVVSMFCGNATSGGLVDRLRGAMSVYQICKQTGREFKLYFTHPFLLTDYLVPASYDWTIASDEVCFNPQLTQCIISDTQTDTRWERRYQKKLLTKRMKKYSDKQLHCYTNVALCYDKTLGASFSEIFHELFKPSLALQKHLEKLAQDIGKNYITVSARFCNLLDDFNEEVYGEPLCSTEREALLKACMKQMEMLREKHPDKHIVACSDSTTFLQWAEKEYDVYVIPGSISHIGNDDADSYEHYEKTFLDFFTIANASRAYLLLGPDMHPSGFPYAAALSNSTPYETIVF